MRMTSHAASTHVRSLWLALVALCCLSTACDRSTGPGDEPPDARPIVYFRLETQEANWALYRVSATGGAPTRLSLAMRETLYPAVSPDGSKLAFLSESNPAGIYVSAADGAGARLIYAQGAV